VTELIFRIDGKTPQSKERLKSSHSGKHSEDLILYKKIPDTPSGPTDFIFLRASRPSSISSMLIEQVLGRSWHRNENGELIDNVGT